MEWWPPQALKSGTRERDPIREKGLSKRHEVKEFRMRSSQIIRGALNPMTSVLPRDRRGEQRGEGRAQTEAEVGVMWPPAQESWGQQREKRRERTPFWGLRGERGPEGTPVSDFWPPQLWEHQFLLSAAPQFVVICDGSPRELTQP